MFINLGTYINNISNSKHARDNILEMYKCLVLYTVIWFISILP